MRLVSLRVEQLPGLTQPLYLQDITAGVTVVVGPNASGKSSLVRALMAVLYPREHEGVLRVEAEFRSAAGTVLTARRLGQDVAWEHDGRAGSPPALPPFHLVGAYAVRLEDLVAADRPPTTTTRSRGRPRALQRSESAAGGVAVDDAIAAAITKELSGGIDIAAVRSGIGTQAEAGQKLARAVRETANERKRLADARAALREREERLPTLEAELAAARAVANRSRIVADAVELLGARRVAEGLAAGLADYPAGLDALRGGEYDTLVELNAQAAAEERRARELDREAEVVRSRLGTVVFSPEVTKADVDLHVGRAEELSRVAEDLAAKAVELTALKARRRAVERRVGAPDAAAAAVVGASDAAAAAVVGASDAAAAIGPVGAGTPVTISDATIEHVERLLESRQAAIADVNTLERHVRRLEAEGFDGGEPATEDEDLVRLRADLLRWLGYPHLALRRPAWAWGVALALTVAAVVVDKLDVATTVLAGVAGGAGLWLLITSLLLRTPTTAAKRQVEAEILQAVARLGSGAVSGGAVSGGAVSGGAVSGGIVSGGVRSTGSGSGPAATHGTGLGFAATSVDSMTWSHRSVADQVAAIDRELAERARHRAERRRRESALRDAVVDLDAARTRRDEAQGRLDDLRTRHGFTIGPDVRLGAWLHATRDLADVTSQLAAVQAAGSRLFERVNRTAADLKRFLVEVGAKTTEATDSLEHDQLHAALRELARLVEQRDADRARLVGLERERERAGDAIRRLASERSRLLDEASVKDDADADAELRRRIDLLQGWRDQSEKLRLANAAVSQLELRIEHDDRLFELVATGDDEALHSAAAECREASLRSEELAETMRRTKDDIQRAASDRTIERATSRLAEATEELTAHRDEALRLEAARFLLDQVESEHRAESRPPELERAATLFESFTRGAFTLRMASEGGVQSRIAAADAAGELVMLDELSTGTRSQLLLASRLGFALEAETRVRDTAQLEPETPLMVLPFVLDEALTTSDPERFAAVAAALLDVAAGEGRQVIYLSARQDDAELWQRAATLHGSTIGVVQLGDQGAGSVASPAAS